MQQLHGLCRLGAIARKHGSYASCVRMTNTLYGFNAMEVQEAFVKIREQVSVEQLSHEPLISCHMSPAQPSHEP